MLREEAFIPGGGRSGSTLYLELFSDLGGGEALRSESDSETALRGREAVEGFQFWVTGEARGFGSVEIPERTLYRSLLSRVSCLDAGGELLRSDSDSEGTLRGGIDWRVERKGGDSRGLDTGLARFLRERRSLGRDFRFVVLSESRSEISSSSELLSSLFSSALL